MTASPFRYRTRAEVRAAHPYDLLPLTNFPWGMAVLGWTSDTPELALACEPDVWTPPGQDPDRHDDVVYHELVIHAGDDSSDWTARLDRYAPPGDAPTVMFPTFVPTGIMSTIWTFQAATRAEFEEGLLEFHTQIAGNPDTLAVFSALHTAHYVE